MTKVQFDEVKTDKSLVDAVRTDTKNQIIVKNMFLMCNELENIHTQAEGIETEGQAEFHRSMNCHLGKGYHYSRPIPSEEFLVKYINK